MSAMTALWVTRTVGVAKLTVHPIERLEHEHACLAVERTGGFVAQEQIWLFHDGSRDSDALLLPAGKAAPENGRADQ